MILIKLRYNIGLCKIRLKDDKELIKNNPYNSYFELKYNDTFDFYKENIRIVKELFNIDISDYTEPINVQICECWPTILKYLKTANLNYDNKKIKKVCYY